MTQAMTFSAFKGPFEQRIDDWNTALQNTSEVLDEWVKVQRNWMYLQPIFDSDDINKQLPVEGKRFSSVDKHWRSMMAGAKKNPKCIQFCNDARLLAKLQESNELLDMVSESVSTLLRLTLYPSHRYLYPLSQFLRPAIFARHHNLTRDCNHR